MLVGVPGALNELLKLITKTQEFWVAVKAQHTLTGEDELSTIRMVSVNVLGTRALSASSWHSTAPVLLCCTPERPGTSAFTSMWSISTANLQLLACAAPICSMPLSTQRTALTRRGRQHSSL